MAKTLEAHDKLIREIFEGSYQFEIPDYQRPYAWTTEQAGELFDDLISAMQEARISGATSQYFLGSIVLIKNDREPKSSVVDGQQRLSTLTMLFAVLREAIPHVPGEQAAKDEAQHAVGQPHCTGAQRIGAVHRRRRPRREQPPPLGAGKRLARSHHRVAPQHLL